MKVTVTVDVTQGDIRLLYKALETADESYVQVTDNMVRLVRALDYALTDKLEKEHTDDSTRRKELLKDKT